MNRSNHKWQEAVKLFRATLQRWEKSKDDAVLYAALTKTFETAFEYTWKHFKVAADEAGQEVYSPRDSLKAAAQLGLISSLELWNEFLNARNLSVHDYLRATEIDFERVVRKFDSELKSLTPEFQA